MRFPRSAAIVAILGSLGGCRGPTEHAGTPTPVAAEPGRAALPEPPEDAAAPLAEAAARALLADRFRSHGFRIRYDVRVQGSGYDVTVDGYDAAARVGYEYVAVIERDTDLDPAERVAMAADPDHHILIADPADSASLEARITAFFESLTATTPP